MTELWLSLDRSGVFGGRTRIGRTFSAMRRALRRNTTSIYDPDTLRGVIEASMPSSHLEDLPIRTAVVVTDALLGRPKTITQGVIATMLEATTAFPGIFPPVKTDGCYYVDGSVTANVPIHQAVALGAKSLVILDANPPSMPGTIPNSVVGSVLHASKIMLRNQRADADDLLKGRLPILHLPQPTPPEQDPFDFGNAAELIKAGFLSTRSFLSELPDLADPSRRLSEAPPSTTSPPPPVRQDPPEATASGHRPSHPSGPRARPTHDRRPASRPGW